MKISKLFTKFLAWTMVFAMLSGNIPAGVFAEEFNHTFSHLELEEETDDIKTEDEHGSLDDSDDIVLKMLGNPNDDFYLQIYEYGEIESGYDLVLPTRVEGFLEDGSSVFVEGVTWSSYPAFDPEEPGLYFFTPHLPAGYRLAQEDEPLLIVVHVLEPEMDFSEIDLLQSFARSPGMMMSFSGPVGTFIKDTDTPISAGSIPISDRAGLEAMANDLSANYHLTADIDLSTAEWEPLANNDEFTGILDGQGHLIWGLENNAASLLNFGLIAILGEDGIIKNLGFENVSIAPDSSGYVAAIATYNYGTIENCFVNGGTIEGGQFTGSIAAYNYGTITNTYNTAAVTVDNYDSFTGGIAAINNGSYGGGIISYCFNSGAISNRHRAAGIAAVNQEGAVIERSYNQGTITATGTSNTPYSPTTYAAGLVGDHVESSILRNCYNTGTIISHAGGTNNSSGGYGSASGLVNYIDNSLINSLYNAGTVKYENSQGTTYGSHVRFTGGGGFSNVYLLYGTADQARGDSASNALFRTETQMQTKSTFNFNFDTTWQMNPAVNNGFPTLIFGELYDINVTPFGFYVDYDSSLANEINVEGPRSAAEGALVTLVATINGSCPDVGDWFDMTGLRTIKALSLKDASGNEIDYAIETTHYYAMPSWEISFVMPKEEVTLDITTGPAGVINSQGHDGFDLTINDTSVINGADFLILLTRFGVASGNAVRLQYARTDFSKLIESVSITNTATGAQVPFTQSVAAHNYTYTFTMPDADVTVLVTTATDDSGALPITYTLPNNNDFRLEMSGDPAGFTDNGGVLAAPGVEITATVFYPDGYAFQGVTPADLLNEEDRGTMFGENYITFTFDMPGNAVHLNFSFLEILSVLAEQKGGVSGFATSDYIELAFDKAISLPFSAVSINGTLITQAMLSAANPLLTVSDTWRISLSSMMFANEAAFTVAIANFGGYTVTDQPAPITVYRRGAEIDFSLELVGGTPGLYDTTGIIIKFDEPVSSLARTQITFNGLNAADWSDPVAIGTDGTEWLIGVDIKNLQAVTANAGITISDGADYRIVPTARNITIGRSSTTIVTFNASANGTDWTADTTAITLTFSQAVNNLTADMIKLSDPDIVKGILTGSGTTRTLAISGSFTNGTPVTVSIDPAVWAGTANWWQADSTPVVNVYKDSQTRLTYTVDTDGAFGRATTRNLIFTFSEAIDEFPGTLEFTAAAISPDLISANGIPEKLDALGMEWAYPVTFSTNLSGTRVSIDPLPWFIIAGDNNHFIELHRMQDLSYTVQQLGGSGITVSSTGILLIFNESVELTKDDLSLSISGSQLPAGYTINPDIVTPYNNDMTGTRWLIPIAPTYGMLGHGSHTLRVTVGDANGRLNTYAPGVDERTLAVRARNVNVSVNSAYMLDFYVTRSAGNGGGQDGAADTLGIAVTIFDINGRPLTAHNGFGSFNEQTNIVIEGVAIDTWKPTGSPIQRRVTTRWNDDDGSVTFSYGIAQQFENGDTATVAVSGFIGTLGRSPENYQHYVMVDPAPKTVTLYKDTRFHAAFSAEERGFGGMDPAMQLFGEVRPIILSLNTPAPDDFVLEPGHIEIRMRDGTLVPVTKVTRISNTAWELERASSNLEGTAIVTITHPRAVIDSFYGLPLMLRRDSRIDINIDSVEQLDGIDEEKATRTLRVTLSSTRAALNQPLTVGIDVLNTGRLVSNNTVIATSNGDGTWTAEFKIRRDADSDRFLYLNALVRNGDNLTVRLNHAGNRTTTFDPDKQQATVIVYNSLEWETMNFDRVRLDAASPSVIHTSQTDRTINLSGFWGDYGLFELSKIHIVPKDGSSPHVIDIEALPEFYVQHPLPSSVFQHSLKVTLPNAFGPGLYDIYFETTGDHPSTRNWNNPGYRRDPVISNTITVEITEDISYVRNIYGILAVTQRANGTFAVETFAGENMSGKAAGQTLLTVRGVIDGQSPNEWKIVGDALINNVLDFRAPGQQNALTVKQNDGNVIIESQNGTLNWNGIRVMNGFRIDLDSTKTYRNERTAAQMGNINLSDVLIENYGGQNASFDFFIMAGESNAIKVYEKEFSVGGSISITGGLPNFLEDSLEADFNMYDMILGGEALSGMPPLHATANAKFEPGKLFGSFISAKGDFGFGLNTLPEVNPNYMEMRGKVGLADVFTIEGEFVFAWGRLGNRVVFMPDTMYVYAGIDQAAGIPLIPPIVVGYITGLGGGVSGLAQTAFGNFDRLPPVKLTMTASFKDVTGKILSVEKATLTVGPTQFSFIVEEAELMKVVKLKDTGFEMRLVERNGFIDSTLELRANMEVLGGLISGHASLYLATIRSNMSSTEQAYYSSIAGGSFRLPEGYEADALQNGFYFEGKLWARVEANLLGIQAAAWGELFVSKVKISGGVGASLNVWNILSVGFEAYVTYTFADNKFSFGRSMIPADEGLVIAVDDKGNKMMFGNIRSRGSASSGNSNPLARVIPAPGVIIGVETGDLIAIYTDTKYTEVDVYIDDVLHEVLLSDDGGVWQETDETQIRSYVAFYVAQADGDYSFGASGANAGGALWYDAYLIEDLPKLASLSVSGTEAKWTLDVAASDKASVLGERLRVRLSLYNAHGDIVAELGDYSASGLNHNFASALPGNLDSGEYSISAMLYERSLMPFNYVFDNDDGTSTTITQYDEDVYHIMASNSFNYTNANAPGAVDGVSVTELPNGEFRVTWNAVTGADGYIVDVVGSDGAMVNGLYDHLVEGGDETSVVFQGGAVTVTDIETGENLHFGIQFGETYTVYVRAYKNIVGTDPLNAGFTAPLLGAAGNAILNVSEPIIPELWVSVDGANIIDNGDGGIIYAVASRDVTVKITTETTALGVTIDGVSAAGSGGVYALSFIVADDGAVNIPVVVTGATGDTNATVVSVLIDTIAPVIFVDSASGLANGGKINVSGFLSGGNELYVNGTEVDLDNGLFSYKDDMETTTISLGMTDEGEEIFGAAITTLSLMAVSPSGRTAETSLEVIYVAEEKKDDGPKAPDNSRPNLPSNPEPEPTPSPEPSPEPDDLAVAPSRPRRYTPSLSQPDSTPEEDLAMADSPGDGKPDPEESQEAEADSEEAPVPITIDEAETLAQPEASEPSPGINRTLVRWLWIGGACGLGALIALIVLKRRGLLTVFFNNKKS
ncbi:MAG: hypothetical protein FWG91_05900 [Lachnospiraceae bacterium]|nr:hypothetical protein [Lachnospiraceae bacterium]